MSVQEAQRQSVLVSDRQTRPVGAARANSSVMRGDAIDWAARQLSPLTQLPPNWDGYGAAAPREELVVAALFILSGLKLAYLTPDPYVSPTPDGGVSLEWEKGAKYLEIDVETPNSANYLYTDSDNNARRSGKIIADEPLEQGILFALKLLFR